jgi:hypothetical protein
VLLRLLAADLDAEGLERLAHLLQDGDHVHARAAAEGGGEQLHGSHAVARLVERRRQRHRAVGAAALEAQALALPLHHHRVGRRHRLLRRRVRPGGRLLPRCYHAPALR